MVWSFRLASRVAAVSGLLVFAVASPAQADSARGWTAKSVTGEVRIERPGAARSTLAPGDRIAAGATIEARGNAQAVLTRDGGDTVTLSPNSSLQLADSGGTATKLLQKLGTALFKVTTRPSWSFEVETPYMVAVVKGTSFTVSVRNEGAAVQVIEGAVQVARPDGRDAALLRPGQTATARPGGSISVGASAKPAAGEKRSEIKDPSADAPAPKADALAGSATASAEKPRRLETASAGQAAVAALEQRPEKVALMTPENPGRAGGEKTRRIDRTIGLEAPDFGAVTNNFVGNGHAPQPQRGAARKEQPGVSNGPVRDTDTAATTPPPAANPPGQAAPPRAQADNPPRAPAISGQGGNPLGQGNGHSPKASPAPATQAAPPPVQPARIQVAAPVIPSSPGISPPPSSVVAPALVNVTTGNGNGHGLANGAGNGNGGKKK